MLYDSICIKILKCKLIYCHRKQISPCLGRDGGDARKGRKEGRIQKGTGNFRRLMAFFIIVILVMVSWVYTYVKSYQIMHFKYAVDCMSITRHKAT